MLTIPDGWEEWGVALGMVAAVGTWLWHTGRAVAGRVQAAYAAHEAIHAQQEYTLQQLLEQVRPNGGQSLRDVVDRIEREVLATSAMNRGLLDLSDTAYFEADERGHFVFVNRRWCDLTGLSPEEARGTGWTLGVHAEDRGTVAALWDEAIDEWRPFRVTHRLCHATSGAITLVHVRALPVRHGTTLRGYIGSAVVEGQTP